MSDSTKGSYEYHGHGDTEDKCAACTHPRRLHAVLNWPCIAHMPNCDCRRGHPSICDCTGFVEQKDPV